MEENKLLEFCKGLLITQLARPDLYLDSAKINQALTVLQHSSKEGFHEFVDKLLKGILSSQ